MAEQLTFDLPMRTALGRADYFVSPANGVAVAGIDGWRNWRRGKMVLVGPDGAGKTHLAHVWAEAAAARVLPAADLAGLDLDDIGPGLAVEDADRGLSDAQETALFHLHNTLAAKGGALLLTARLDPARWPLRLADLKSRVQQAGVLKLGPPDDALLAALMVKLATDRQIRLDPGLITYALLRMERSFGAAQALIAEIDARSLRDKTRPGKAMVAAILAQGDE
jgi:chromosomal replication initiation ATPase DnaA